MPTRISAKRRRILARFSEERGTALVEMAIVLPVLMMIIMGVLYFGRYLSYQNSQTHMAEMAVRWAAVNVNPGSGTLQAYVVQQAPAELQSGSSDVTTPVHVYLYYPTGSAGGVGSAVRACVTSTVKFVPIIGVGSTQVTATATMRVEQTATNWTADSSPPSQCPTS